MIGIKIGHGFNVKEIEAVTDGQTCTNPLCFFLPQARRAMARTFTNAEGLSMGLSNSANSVRSATCGGEGGNKQEEMKGRVRTPGLPPPGDGCSHPRKDKRVGQLSTR